MNEAAGHLLNMQKIAPAEVDADADNDDDPPPSSPVAAFLPVLPKTTTTNLRNRMAGLASRMNPR